MQNRLHQAKRTLQESKKDPTLFREKVKVKKKGKPFKKTDYEGPSVVRNQEKKKKIIRITQNLCEDYEENSMT